MAELSFFDAVQGVEPQSETVWRQADRYLVPRICFINKMDRMDASFERSVQSIIDRLGANPIPMQIPMGEEANFIGVIDLMEMKSIVWENPDGREFNVGEIPAEYKEAAEFAREQMVEKTAELDDELIEKFLEGETISNDELKSSLRRAVLDNKATLVFCGSSLKNKGVRLINEEPLDLPGRKMAFIHPKSANGVLVELYELV